MEMLEKVRLYLIQIEIKVVVSSQKDAYALTRAANAGIPGVAVVKKECGSQEAYEEALMQVLGEYDIDMIVLAGYLSILSGNFTRKWPNMDDRGFPDNARRCYARKEPSVWAYR